jgi:hypothetical protein
MVSQMESCYTDSDTYTGCPGSDTGLPVGSGVGQVQAAADSTGKGYTITATSKSNNVFTITKDPTTGVTTRGCTVPASGTAKGGCPASGSW